MSTDPNAISEAIVHFYNRMYTEDMSWRPKLDGLDFFMIPVKDATWLDRPFDEEEVEGVLRGFNGDKALVPDGFPMTFLQICRYIVRNDIMEVI